MQAVRLPSNAVIMSMMALMLIIGAPALVSAIDDEAATDVHYEKDIQVVSAGLDATLKWSADTPAETDKTFSVLVEDNTIIIALTTPASKAYITSLQIFNIDSATIDGLVSLDVVSDFNIKPYISTNVGGVYKQFHNFEATATSGGFSYSPSSYDRVLLSSDDCFGFAIDFNGAFLDSSIYTVTITAEYGTTIPYGEIIIGVTGVLLIVCAILATPWFSMNGLNIRKKKGVKND